MLKNVWCTWWFIPTEMVRMALFRLRPFPLHYVNFLPFLSVEIIFTGFSL